ncbi:MAG: DNA gyrase subunit A [Thermotogae bacterium]|mgnify:CR=1 FL=1|nr:MAG: DNA gyrase subunit A [Thermotogota bacterium]
MENILSKPIEDELVESYMNYSMSVIIGRAIPDVRDGLKPVQRRILYAMRELGLTHNSQSKKSARIVGEVLGKYHPHGDLAVYDALVRMAQNFNMRYPLIIGQGNFGSIDRDPPAAMRYTEAKMSRISEEMLQDIEKDTVQMAPNFDETLKEPSVLPGKVPNLLLNGSTGIAVGMATSIPPHNLNEIVDAIQLLIRNPNASHEEIMKFVKGPDFPTGATIMNGSELIEAYRTGRGRAVVRGTAELEETEKSSRIVISEIPYSVSKAGLIKEIASYAERNPKMYIKDIRDESDRSGMRIVIELSRNAKPSVVINNLYKHTSLQTTFSIQMLVIDHNKPKLMGIRELLLAFIAHRFEVIRRRSEYDLKVLSRRAHLLEGIMKAARAIGVVIDIIRSSKDNEEATKNLIETLEVTEEQSKAILEMKLGRLTGLETEKLQSEYSELTEKLRDIKDILVHDERVYEIMYSELEELKSKYGDARRTKIVNGGELSYNPEDLIVDEEIVVTLSEKGYIKATNLNSYRSQRRGGKGKIGAKIAVGDEISIVCISRLLERSLFISSKGRAFVLKNYELQTSGRDSKGKPIQAYLNLEEDEQVLTMIPFSEWKGDLILVTRKGRIKRTPLEEFQNAGSRGIRAITFVNNDSVVTATLSRSVDENIMIATRNGMVIKFPLRSVRRMGRTAMGVIGIRLRDNDEVVGMVTIQDDSLELLSITSKGFGKRTSLAEYRVQSRGGMGVKNLPSVAKAGHISGVEVVQDLDSDVIVMTKNGVSIRFHISTVSVLSRTARGVKIVNLSKDDEVSHFAIVEQCIDS